jgi:hypothetical protein
MIVRVSLRLLYLFSVRAVLGGLINEYERAA